MTELVAALTALHTPALREATLVDASSRDAAVMRATYWVLDGNGPLGALAAAIPRLAAQLDRRTNRRRVEATTMRGKLDWAATIRARAASGSEAALVSRVVQRSYDVPENQLVYFVVHRALAALDAVPPAIRDGLLQEPRAGAVAVGAVRERIESLRGALRDRGMLARLASVTLPPRIDARWLTAAKASDVRDYALAVRAFEAWRDDVAAATWRIAVPGGVVLLPADADPAWLALAARRTQRALRVGGR